MLRPRWGRWGALYCPLPGLVIVQGLASCAIYDHFLTTQDTVFLKAALPALVGTAFATAAASRAKIDLNHAPYVLYGVKDIGLVSLAPFSTLRWPVGHKLHQIETAQHLDLRRVSISDPGPTLGAGAKTRIHTPKPVT